MSSVVASAPRPLPFAASASARSISSSGGRGSENRAWRPPKQAASGRSSRCAARKEGASARAIASPLLAPAERDQALTARARTSPTSPARSAAATPASAGRSAGPANAARSPSPSMEAAPDDAQHEAGRLGILDEPLERPLASTRPLRRRQLLRAREPDRDERRLQRGGERAQQQQREGARAEEGDLFQPGVHGGRLPPRPSPPLGLQPRDLHPVEDQRRRPHRRVGVRVVRRRPRAASRAPGGCPRGSSPPPARRWRRRGSGSPSRRGRSRRSSRWSCRPGSR